MLIYTHKLEKYIRKKIFPKVLIVPNKYSIKGSFRRKIPYITDIDVVNEIYPEINENNIYDKLLHLIGNIKNSKPEIILTYITCGVDERFNIETASNEELDRIRPLLDTDDTKKLDLIIKKYENHQDKRKFYVNELVWKYYKLRWTPKNVINNKMKLAGNLIIKFTDIVKKYSSVLLQFYVKIGSYPLGIDVIANYKPIDMTKAYQCAAEYQLKLANYGREYYFMLFPFKFLFRNDKKIRQELEDLIEKKFGLYKQLMVRIDTFHTLHETGNLDIGTASSIITSIIKDIEYLPDFQSNIISKIKEISIDNPSDIKIKMWDTLLDVLYDELNSSVNFKCKDYFYHYLKMVPNDLKSKYFLNGNGNY